MFAKCQLDETGTPDVEFYDYLESFCARRIFLRVGMHRTC